MSGVNKAIVLGRLGNDPDVRMMPNGNSVANLSVATSEKYKDKSGQQVENTEWHRVIFFGKLAEIAGQYLTKGSMIYVEGKIQTKKWQDQSGNDRYTTEIIGREMQMLDSKQANQQPNQQPRQQQPQQQEIDDFQDQRIPF